MYLCYRLVLFATSNAYKLKILFLLQKKASCVGQKPLSPVPKHIGLGIALQAGSYIAGKFEAGSCFSSQGDYGSRTLNIISFGLFESSPSNQAKNNR